MKRFRQHNTLLCRTWTRVIHEGLSFLDSGDGIDPGDEGLHPTTCYSFIDGDGDGGFIGLHLYRCSCPNDIDYNSRSNSQEYEHFSTLNSGDP